VIKESIPVAFSHVNNEYHLIDKLNETRLDSGYKLIFLNMVLLFTNIPLELTTYSIEKRWGLINDNRLIPKNKFMGATNLVLNSTSFHLIRNFTSKQHSEDGLSFVSDSGRFSHKILEIVAIKKMSFHIPFYFRYVDDILMAERTDALDFIKETFNSFHDRLQFTLESEDNNRINLLNVTSMHSITKLFDMF
jgi:hypothetical protein